MLSLPVSGPNEPVLARLGVWLIEYWYMLGLKSFSNSVSVAQPQTNTFLRKQNSTDSVTASPIESTITLTISLIPVLCRRISISVLIASYWSSEPTQSSLTRKSTFYSSRIRIESLSPMYTTCKMLFPPITMLSTSIYLSGSEGSTIPSWSSIVSAGSNSTTHLQLKHSSWSSAAKGNSWWILCWSRQLRVSPFG